MNLQVLLAGRPKAEVTDAACVRREFDDSWLVATSCNPPKVLNTNLVEWETSARSKLR